MSVKIESGYAITGAIYPDRWIKCSDLMPEEMQMVLVTGPDADRPFIKTNFADRHTWSQAVAYWHGPAYAADPAVTWALDADAELGIQPTHWQPLPEPPKP